MTSPGAMHRQRQPGSHAPRRAHRKYSATACAGHRRAMTKTQLGACVGVVVVLLAGFVAAAKYPAVFGPPLEDGPVLATAGPNRGRPCEDCIFVPVLTCFKTWDRTQVLLRQLLVSTDNLHVVVFDDMSDDDTKERAEAMGIAVLQPHTQRNVGMTAQMNLMWAYFHLRPELISMFVMNNDLQVSPFDTFTRFNRCIQSIQGPAVVSAMSDRLGTGGGMALQDAEDPRHVKTYGHKVPEELRGKNLPGTLEQYSEWLGDALAPLDGNTSLPVKNFIGFVMGFKKDHPMADPKDNVFLKAGRDAHQEYFMISVQKIPAYLCRDVFMYHNKTNSWRIKDDIHSGNGWRLLEHRV